MASVVYGAAGCRVGDGLGRKFVSGLLVQLFAGWIGVVVYMTAIMLSAW